MPGLIAPHGGALKGRSGSITGMRVTVTDTMLADAYMIGTGAYSPIEGFLGHQAAWSVFERMRLPDGLLWAIPPLCAIDPSIAGRLQRGDRISLCDALSTSRATVIVHQVFSFDVRRAAKMLFGTHDESHPGVSRYLAEFEGKLCVSGQVVLTGRPHMDIASKYLLDPRDVRDEFSRRQWSDVIAFQTRNPIHRAHEYLIRVALEVSDSVLIHPIIGPTKHDDIPSDVRFSCYEALVEQYFDPARIMLAGLAAPMRYAGPREAIHHLIIRKNFGVRGMIIGRDHAGIGGYYGAYDAQRISLSFAPELGMRVLALGAAFYCTLCDGVVSERSCPHSEEGRIELSGTAVRSLLRSRHPLPAQFTRPEVSSILTQWACGSDQVPTTARVPRSGARRG
jgi:sulfate adenylyltransferase